MYIIADEERESLFRYSGNMGKILFPAEKKSVHAGTATWKPLSTMRAWPFLPSAFCCDGLVSPCSSHFGAGAATGGDGAGPCGTNQPSCAAARLNIPSDDGKSRSCERLFPSHGTSLATFIIQPAKRRRKVVLEAPCSPPWPQPMLQAARGGPARPAALASLLAHG